jgi:hypothetical protein
MTFRTVWLVLALNTFFCLATGFSQDSTWRQSKRNAAFLELFGGPRIYSFNYQRITASATQLTFTYRGSVSFLPLYGTSISGYVGGLLGKPSSAFELLIGVGYFGRDITKRIFPEEQSANLYVSPQIGYRRQKNTNSLLFRFMLTPWLFVNDGIDKSKLRLSVGISIGKSF